MLGRKTRLYFTPPRSSQGRLFFLPGKVIRFAHPLSLSANVFITSPRRRPCPAAVTSANYGAITVQWVGGGVSDELMILRSGMKYINSFFFVTCLVLPPWMIE